MYQRPTPVAQPDYSRILDAAEKGYLPEALQDAGAINANAPLPRSSHLKNIRTGIVFPYMERMAQMRDVMVNCDQYGNTDPAAWQPTVTDGQDYDPREQAVLMQQALVNLEKRLTVAQQAAPPVNDPKARELPHGAEFFDKFAMTEDSAEVIDQLSAMI